MNEHLNDGQLRAALDGELDTAGMHHLEACAVCRARQDTVRALARSASRGLSFLSEPSPSRGPADRTALSRFYRETQIRKENSMYKKLFASPLLRVGLAAVIILALILSFPTTRALADQILNLFRVQQVVVVPVDFTGMQQLTGNDTFGKQVGDLISNSVTVD